MKHLILLAYILIFSTGFAALSALIVMSVRVAGLFPRRMIIIQSLFIANLALVALYYYLEQVLELVGPFSSSSSSSSSLTLGFALVASILNISLYGAIMFLLGVPEMHRSRARNLAFGGCSVTITLMLISLIFQLSVLQRAVPALRFTIYLAVAFTMTTVGIALAMVPLGKSHASSRLLVRGLGWCCLGFVPLSMVEYAVVLSGFKTYHPLSMEYLFYLGCNVVMILAAFLSLERDASSQGSFGEYTSEMGKRFGLTGREIEMANLIAQGKTNKEIAFSLSISEATVRTHIYNLFQKVGASSRIELLNLLHD
ncbi:MAG: helix-turn-helix transcriptional regulator [Sphaerochaeta sp.]|nr:helix-turn-helix transcriptional regulator [Sphaerochaeta sp.]